MQHAEVVHAAVDAPSRGAVLALAASPDAAHDRTVFSATMAGLYRSQGGGTWERQEIAAEDVPLLSLALSPAIAQGGVLLAGAVEGGVLRSADSGMHWSLANFGGRQPHCATLILSPDFRNDGIAFAGTMRDGIFHSQDRGASWQARNFGLLDLNVLALVVSPDFAQDDLLYAATPSGVFRSSNGARAWREVASPAAAAVQCLAYAAAADGTGTLFAGTDGAGVFRSDDRGASWCPTGEVLAGACINALALHSEGAHSRTLFALTDSALYLSGDAGDRWEQCAEAAGALCLFVSPDFSTGGPIMIGLSEHGIARSTDLTLWQTAPVVEIAATG